MGDFFFFSGVTVLVISVFAHLLDKRPLSLLLLLVSAALLFLFAISLYPFLNVWDERFHALVAKNLMNHPLMPTLFDETPITAEYDRWDRYHIWLHKQPLFLWQIALSFKLFGVNEFALRLPMLVLGVVLVYAAYRSGKILVNDKAGYYCALLMTTCFYSLELMSGRQELEHNDFTFVCYISLSIWCWLEYENGKNRWWLIPIGIFSGFAILCKWLPGLLVYLGWGIISVIKNKLQIRKYWDLALSLVITIVVALPWQLLIFKWYPKEAEASYQYNIDHFNIPLDGHEGPITYHFNLMDTHYGNLVPFLIIPASIILFWKAKDRLLPLALICNILFVFLFYTLVQTKMPSFTFILVLPVFIFISCFIDFVASLRLRVIRNQLFLKSAMFLFLIVMVYLRINIPTLKEKHGFLSESDSYFSNLQHNKKVFQELSLPAKTIIFNVKGRHNIESMFYSGFTSYNFIPTEKQYLEAKTKQRPIAVFVNNDSIPQYLKSDQSVFFLTDTIHLCE